MTNSNHETRFLFLRGPNLTIEMLNLYKGKCIFEENPTCAQKDRSTQKKNGTPMDGYKYKSNVPHLQMIIKQSSFSSLVLARTSLRQFAEIGLHKSEMIGSEACTRV